MSHNIRFGLTIKTFYCR